MRDAYITGVAESALGKVLHESELSMAATASREALQEAGLALADVDGLFVNYMGEEGSVQVGEYLGIQPRWSDSTDLGGAAFEAFVHHAATAIAAGRCDVALITYASRQRSLRRRRLTFDDDLARPLAQFHNPHGLPAPIGNFALMAARHMHEYGTTSEQLAEVAVAARTWAQMNPKAWRRETLTVADVLASPMLADPLHVLDVCLQTDGGGAVVLTDASRARNATKGRVKVLGAGESHSHWSMAQMPDLTTSAVRAAGRDAFAQAGLTPSDVDVFQPYDAMTVTVLIQLEDLGFCAPGEAGAFVAEGNLAPGGRLPSMTSGGGLSYNHPGALGLLLLVEAVRQLRGECGPRQVPDCEVACVSGIGGFFSCGATVLLGHD
jgi:acetyl-CoA acetyltransferase